MHRKLTKFEYGYDLSLCQFPRCDTVLVSSKYGSSRHEQVGLHGLPFRFRAGNPASRTGATPPGSPTNKFRFPTIIGSDCGGSAEPLSHWPMV